MIASAFIAPAAMAEQDAAPDYSRPDCAEAPYSALNFMIGRWEVTDNKSQTPFGVSVIKQRPDDCAIVEVMDVEGSEVPVEVVSSFDDEEEQAWTQVWFGISFAHVRFWQVASQDNIVFEAHQRSSRYPKRQRSLRVMYARDHGGGFRQRAFRSADGGEIWSSTVDLTYRPQKD